MPPGPTRFPGFAARFSGSSGSSTARASSTLAFLFPLRGGGRGRPAVWRCVGAARHVAVVRRQPATWRWAGAARSVAVCGDGPPCGGGWVRSAVWRWAGAAPLHVRWVGRRRSEPLCPSAVGSGDDVPSAEERWRVPCVTGSSGEFPARRGNRDGFLYRAERGGGWRCPQRGSGGECPRNGGTGAAPPVGMAVSTPPRRGSGDDFFPCTRERR